MTEVTWRQVAERGPESAGGRDQGIWVPHPTLAEVPLAPLKELRAGTGCTHSPSLPLPVPHPWRISLSLCLSRNLQGTKHKMILVGIPWQFSG